MCSRFVSFSGASGGKLYLLLLRIKIDGEEFVASNKSSLRNLCEVFSDFWWLEQIQCGTQQNAARGVIEIGCCSAACTDCHREHFTRRKKHRSGAFLLYFSLFIFVSYLREQSISSSSSTNSPITRAIWSNIVQDKYVRLSLLCRRQLGKLYQSAL